MSDMDITIPDEAYAAALQVALERPGEIRPLILAAIKAWPIQFSDVDAKGRNVMMLVSPFPPQETDA